MSTSRSNEKPELTFKVLVVGIPHGKSDNEKIELETSTTIELPDAVVKLELHDVDEKNYRNKAQQKSLYSGSHAAVFISDSPEKKDQNILTSQAMDVYARDIPHFECPSVEGYQKLLPLIATQLVTQELEKRAVSDYNNLMDKLEKEVNQSNKQSTSGSASLEYSQKELFLKQLKEQTSKLDNSKKLALTIALLKEQAQPKKHSFLDRSPLLVTHSLSSICQTALDTLPPQTMKWAEGIKIESSAVRKNKK